MSTSRSDFNPQAIIDSRGWFDRALEVVAPTVGRKRMEARLSMHLFRYQAAMSDRIFQPKTIGYPSESALTSRDRVVMMWETRDLIENFAPAVAAMRKFSTLLTPTEYAAATGDRDYNQIVNDYFHEWCKRCDYLGVHSFKKLCELATGMRPVDGDCGIIKRQSPDGIKLQLVASDRIGNPNNISPNDANYISGITVDDFGRPVSYRIYTITTQGQWVYPEEVPAKNFCHYFDPFRCDQMRGITDFHSVLQTARMINEILKAEMVGVRYASEQALLIFNERGTAPTRNVFQPNPSPQILPNGQPESDESSKYGTLKYLTNGDSVAQVPSRPSSAFQGFITELERQMALGLRWPYGVLFNAENLKGPGVRAEFAQADRVANEQQGCLADKMLNPIKNDVILEAIASERIPPPPKKAGENYVQTLSRAIKGEFRFPPRLTIDVGRDSAANLNENRQAVKSLQQIAAESGTDAFRTIDECVETAVYIKEQAEKHGISETEIRLPTNTLPTTPAAVAAIGGNAGVVAAGAQAASSPNAAPAGAADDPEDDETDDEPDDSTISPGSALKRLLKGMTQLQTQMQKIMEEKSSTVERSETVLSFLASREYLEKQISTAKKPGESEEDELTALEKRIG